MVVSSTEAGNPVVFVEGVTQHCQRRICGHNGGRHAQRRASISITSALGCAQTGQSQCSQKTSRPKRSTSYSLCSRTALKNVYIHSCRVDYTVRQTRRLKYVGRNWAVGLLLFFAGIGISGQIHSVQSSVYVSGDNFNSSVYCAQREDEETPDILPPSVEGISAFPRILNDQHSSTIRSKSAYFSSRPRFPPSYSSRSLGVGESHRSTHASTSAVRSSISSNCRPTVSVKSFILDSIGSAGSASRLASATPLPDRKSGQVENAVLWNLKKDVDGWFVIEDLNVDHTCIVATVKQGNHVNLPLRISAEEGAKIYLRSTIEYDKVLTTLGDAVGALQAQKANLGAQIEPDVMERVDTSSERGDAVTQLQSAAAEPVVPIDMTLQHSLRTLSRARPERGRKDEDSPIQVNKGVTPDFHGQQSTGNIPSSGIPLRNRSWDRSLQSVTEPLHLAEDGENDNGIHRNVALHALLVDEEKRPYTRTKRRQDLAARVTGIQRTIGVPSSSAPPHRSRGAPSVQSSFRRHPSSTLEPLPSGRHSLATQENPHTRVYSPRSSTRKRESPSNLVAFPDAFQHAFDFSTIYSTHAFERLSPLWDGWEDSVQLMVAEIETLDWKTSDRMLQAVRLQVAAALGSDLAGSRAADADLITTARFSTGASPRASERRNDARGRRLQLSREDVSTPAAHTSEKYPPFQMLHDSMERLTAREGSGKADRLEPRSGVVDQNRLHQVDDSYGTPVSKEKVQSTTAHRTALPSCSSESEYAQRSLPEEAKSATSGGKKESQSQETATPKGRKHDRDSGVNTEPQFLKVVQRSSGDKSHSHHMVVVNIDALGRRLDAKSGKPLFYNDRVIVGWRCSHSELHTIKALGVARESSLTEDTAPQASEEATVSQKPASPVFCSRPNSQGKTMCGQVPPHLELETRSAENQGEHVFTADYPAEMLTPQKEGHTEEGRGFTKASSTRRQSTRGTPRRRLQVLSHMLDHFAAQGIDSVTPLFRRVPPGVVSQVGKLRSFTETDSKVPESRGLLETQTYAQRQVERTSTVSHGQLSAGEEYFTLRGSSPLRFGKEQKTVTTSISNVQPAFSEASGEPENVENRATAHEDNISSSPRRAEQSNWHNKERLTARTLVDVGELCGLDLIKLSLRTPKRSASGTAEKNQFRNDDVTALKAFIDKFASQDYVDDILFITPDAPIRAATGFSRQDQESRNGEVRSQDTFSGADFTEGQLLAEEAANSPVSEQQGDDQTCLTDLAQPNPEYACGDLTTGESGPGPAVAYSVTRSLQATDSPAKVHNAELPNDPLFAVQWALGSSRPHEGVDSDTCFARARSEMLRYTTESPTHGSLTTTAASSVAHNIVTESQLAKIRYLCETVGLRNLHENEAASSSQVRTHADKVPATSEAQGNTNAVRERENTASSSTSGYDVDLHTRQQDEGNPQKMIQKRHSGGSDLWAEGGNNDNSIKMLQAWGLKLKKDQETNHSTVPVAVIDTGVNYGHPDLADSMWINEKEFNGIPGYDDDQNGYIDDVYGWNFLHDNNNPMDDNGHGSHVAGIIGAQRNNHKGVSGISSHARIIALKILDENGDGDVSHAIPAIRYALDNGARIITNSWGGITGPGTHILGVLLREVVSDANSSVFVIASGNDGRDITKEPYYPASFLRDWTITVAAHTPDGILPRWSNYGQHTVHLTAPGENITSTWLGSGYRLSSGTSMAAPMVSGVAAEMLAYSPHLQPQQVVDALIQSGTPEMRQKNASLTGAKLNAFRALILSQMHFFSLSSSELHVGGATDPVGSVNVRMDTGMLPPGIYHGSVELIYVRRVGSKNTSMLTSVFKRRLIQLVQISLPVTMTVL